MIYPTDLDPSEQRAIKSLYAGIAVDLNGKWRIRGTITYVGRTVLARLIGMGLATVRRGKNAAEIFLTQRGREMAAKLLDLRRVRSEAALQPSLVPALRPIPRRQTHQEFA